MRLQATGNPLQQSASQAIAVLLANWYWGLPLLHFFGALILMLLIGNPLIDWLRGKRWKQDQTLEETWVVRDDTPESHQKKQGTPSMGGIGIVAAALGSVVAAGIFLMFCIYGPLNNLSAGSGLRWNAFALQGSSYAGWLLMPCVLLFHGLLGFADDWSKASGRGGLRARTKLFFQCFLAFLFVATLLILTHTQSLTGIRYLFFGQNVTQAGIVLLPSTAFLCLVLIAAGNAVNLTDGIDGLAAGLAVQCGLMFYLAGSDAYEIGQINIFFWTALAGACFGFLFFNKHKARVFMGDTGSLAIGAALGAGAILQGAVFLLPFIGFIYFVEMFSVIAQVAWFKWTKKRTGEGQRLFRRAPLHHHFELCGWSEWRVVATFWAVNLFTSVVGLWLWKAGVLPRWP